MQIAVAPLFGEGFASPFNDILDLAPTWTAAVLIVTGSRRRLWWLVAGLTVLAGIALWWFLRRP